jgi:hypothetical protein
MKNTKSILLAVIAATAVGSASAQTTNVVARNQFNVAGSTALGSITMKELDAYAIGQSYTKQAWDNATPASQKIALYSKLISSATNSKTAVVTQTKDFINVRLVGSEGGTVVAGSKLTQGFLGLGASGIITSSACTNQQTATLTFSDVDQASGSFSGLKGARAKVAKLTKAGDLAAINFVWVSSTNFPASNITAQQARALFTAGHLPLSFFTGDANDSTNGVVAVGRDIDSGTRIAYLAETGLGALASLKQYVFDTVTTNVSLSTAGTLNGVSYAAGDGGESSGGTLCTKIAASANLVGANLSGVTNYPGKIYLIGCAGSKDATGKALKVLSYNGVTPYYPGSTVITGVQTNQNVIAEGSYSLWTIGRLYYNAANAPKGTDKAAIPTVANALAANIATNSSAGFGGGFTAIGDLKVKRTIEGAPITTK